MNKLQGFLELKKSGLPTVPWRPFDSTSVLDDDILWTVRSAIQEGDDQNLPRAIGVTADEAKYFANMLLETLPNNSLVLYYPFFVALKSGVLEISPYRTVIEAVENDLWNLVTEHKCEVSIIFDEEDMKFVGNEKFLSHKETEELIDYCLLVRKLYSTTLAQGKSMFLEWSYAKKSDKNKNGLDNESLVFYEIRAV